MGYVAANPRCEDADSIVPMCGQISRGIGHNCPASLIQMAVKDCLDVTGDLRVYETNMQLIYDELLSLGFTVVKPDGTWLPLLRPEPGAMTDAGTILREETTAADGRVTAIRTERTKLDGNGGVVGTGKFTDWPVGAVYRAVGYRSDAVPEVPFDEAKAVIPNEGGRVDGHVGLYATGWVRRGPVGLIGNTKGDANEAIGNLLADWDEGILQLAAEPSESAVTEFFDVRGIEYTTWDGWHRLDAAERAAGEAEGRERKKFVEWEDMVAHSRDRTGVPAGSFSR